MVLVCYKFIKAIVVSPTIAAAYLKVIAAKKGFKFRYLISYLFNYDEFEIQNCVFVYCLCRPGTIGVFGGIYLPVHKFWSYIAGYFRRYGVFFSRL